MISASFSLSLPRLGWKSTSTPRSLKICTAAGDRASEIRTLGLVITGNPLLAMNFQIVTRGLDPRVHLFGWMAGSSPAMTTMRRTKSRRLCERGFSLGKGPVDPLRQPRDVPGLHRGAAPDPQASRRVAVMREVEAGAFLLHQGNELLGEIGLRVSGERGDRGVDHLETHRRAGADRRILGVEIDERRPRRPGGEHFGFRCCP